MTVNRMIFSLNPGRCGSMYMHKTFRSVPKVVSLHEPWPTFQDANCNGLTHDERLTWLKDEKLHYIKGLAQDNYLETSNQFMRGWPGLLLELGEIPDIIILRRPHREVALSAWRMGYIPARSVVASKYGLNPDDKDALLSCENFSRWTDYQLCYWHCLEVEERVKKFVPSLVAAGSIIAETTLADIRTARGFLELVKELGLPDPDMERMNDLIGVRFNQTRPDLQAKWPHGNLGNQENDVEQKFIK